MDKMKDVVIGFITGYEFDKLKPWIHSLNRSGFTGDKILVVYDISYEVAAQIQNEGITVIGLGKDEENKKFVFNEPFNIVVSRFFHLWHLMRSFDKKYRYVITTDVADVVFQRNPSEWLENNLGDKKICVGSENLRYKDEEWGINNMYQSFGHAATGYMLEKGIYNAGTLAGEFDTFVDLCYNIYLVSKGAPMHVYGGGGPDQAALNLLLSLEPYKSITKFNTHDDEWSCQCGTTVDPNKVKEFRKTFLVDAEPTWHDDTTVTNSKNEKYVLVHQYNRVPEWNEKILQKYAI